MWSEDLPDPVTEPCYRAFLRLWAFFTIGETVTGAAMSSSDIEDTYAVRRHLAVDWDRLHPRVRAWIGESESWWHEVSVAWGPGATDERRRAHLRAYFRPQFVALSRLWQHGGRARPSAWPRDPGPA